MENNTKKIPYRADIDGLRAIAVLSVVLFHVNFNLIHGGFIGVDIFFVISGFLITRIIGTEILENRFSFRGFYVRRIRRILPVFLLVIGVTMIAGRILLLPEDWGALLTSVKYALLFGANIYFSKERGYFDLSSNEKPILHMWSLSVEEQYYLIWPLLLIGMYAINRLVQGRKRTAGQAFVILATFVLVCGGFIFSQRVLSHGSASTKLYFLLQTRFSELMVGSLAALLPRCRNSALENLLSILGFAGMVFALFMTNKNDLFPGYNAVLPCVGTGLILYGGQSGGSEKSLISRILSLPALVYVGMLSYSIYLWHWPILAYMRYVYGSYALPLTWDLTAIALTFALSFVSYRFLESRVKRAPMSFKTAMFGVYLAPSVLLLSICIVGIHQVARARVDEALTTYGVDVCHGNLTMKCVRGDPNKAPTILMFGDSHAAALNSFIDVVGRKEHWSAMVVTGSSCSPVFGFNEKALPDFAQPPCTTLKQYVAENYQKYHAVFIASYWAFQLGWIDMPSDTQYLEKFRHTIEIIAKKMPVYVFSDMPHLPISPFRLAHFQALHFNVNRTWSKQYIAANAVIRKVVQSVPNAHWVDIDSSAKYFDDYGVYRGLPTYLDNQHLNKYGSTKLGEIFSETHKILPQPEPVETSEESN